jgi:Amt family ammonium transporter
MAAMNTILAPAAGSLAWILYDYVRSKKITSLGYCSGVLAGLVCITPACGFVAPWAAVIIGAVGGLVSNFLCHFKTLAGYDDSMDVFGIHGGVGFVGLILTGVFASSSVINLDGTVLAGGAIEGNWSLVGYQTLAAVVCFAWAFFVTLLLAFLFSKVSFLSLRSTDGDEFDGMDHTMMGEVAYEFVPSSIGFVELQKPKKSPSIQEEKGDNTFREVYNDNYIGQETPLQV